MATRELKSSPSVLPLYARAALPMLPGASLLPFVPGGGKDIPDLELTQRGVRIEADRLAQYARVCGFSLRDTVPATYPHILAFPLHMALMTDRTFPFGAVGLVHVRNRITQRAAIRIGDELDLRVRPTPLEDHPKGRTFKILSEARVGGELVWEDESTFLRRGGGGEQAPATKGRSRRKAPEPPPVHATWRLPGDLGRRYAGVSGDRNPIHLHGLTAKPLGFPSAIAHGMWTKARCLAALENRLWPAYTIDVEFKKPILLPGTVTFGSVPDGDDAIGFAVRGRDKDTAHLDGRVERA